MATHSDPTASRAIGAAEKEWRRMTVLAYRLRTDPKAAAKAHADESGYSQVLPQLEEK